MSDKNAKSVIKSYRKRQQTGPFIIWGLAALLIFVGIILLVVWLTGPNKPHISLFATDTPTPTMTFTPTMTPLPTDTPTITPTATITPTSTPSAPFKYIVQEGDSLAVIAEKFNLGDNGILLLLQLNSIIDRKNPIVNVGQEIDVPNPGMQLLTETPLPPDLPSGTKVEYYVQAGDSLAAIASRFNSTVESIVEENKLEDPNAIFVGQLLVIKVNLIKPSPSPLPTITPTGSPGTPTPTVTATAT